MFSGLWQNKMESVCVVLAVFVAHKTKYLLKVAFFIANFKDFRATNQAHGELVCGNKMELI
jgi:hypothetical protein